LLERRTIHIHDIVAEFDEFPDARVNHEQWDHRTTLATPLLREGAAIGTITIRRPEARPFSEQQIKLLETFADQAVIVIENARLFGELERRNAELQESNRQVNEALEQQTATAEVLRVIASSPTDLKAVLEAVVASVARLCAADSANVQRLDGDNVVVLAATHSESAGLIFPIAGTVAEDVIAEMRTVHVFGTVEEQLARYPASPGARMGMGVQASTPLLRGGRPIGVISLQRSEVRPFIEHEIVLLETFADQAVIAIENARLFEELEQRNQELSDALEQQTATAEVLRVIASAPTSLNTVLDTLVRSAARLTAADEAAILRIEGSILPVVAGTSGHAALSAKMVMPLDERSVSGRAIRERRTVRAHEPREEHEAKYPASLLYRIGYQAEVVVPLLHGDGVLGTLIVFRRERRPFNDQQVGLLESFADQAVIAIENARLFEELERRNQELSDALEQQTATAEVLRVIASTPTALHAVLDTLVHSLAQLCDAAGAYIGTVDGDWIVTVATYGTFRAEPVGERRRLDSGTVLGRALAVGQTIHAHDLSAQVADEFPNARLYFERHGNRTVVVTPLRRQDQVIGVMSISRQEARPFTDQQLTLLRSFADQAVIAIENGGCSRSCRTASVSCRLSARSARPSAPRSTSPRY